MRRRIISFMLICALMSSVAPAAAVGEGCRRDSPAVGDLLVALRNGLTRLARDLRAEISEARVAREIVGTWYMVGMLEIGTDRLTAATITPEDHTLSLREDASGTMVIAQNVSLDMTWSVERGHYLYVVFDDGYLTQMGWLEEGKLLLSAAEISAIIERRCYAREPTSLLAPLEEAATEVSQEDFCGTWRLVESERDGLRRFYDERWADYAGTARVLIRADGTMRFSEGSDERAVISEEIWMLDGCALTGVADGASVSMTLHGDLLVMRYHARAEDWMCIYGRETE